MADIQRQLQRASGLYKKGRLKDAAVILKKLISQTPDVIPAINLYGIILAQLGQLVQAAEQFTRLVRLQPSNPGPIENLARTYMKMGDFHQAKKYFEQIINLDPKSYNGYFGLAGALGCMSLAVRRQLGHTLRALTPAYVLRCGSLFVLYELLLYLALGLSASRGQVLEVALVHYLWPMLTLFFSALSLRSRPHPLFYGGGILAMFGVGLAMTQDSAVTWQSFQSNLSGNATPYVVALAAAFAWSLYSVSSRHWSSEGQSGAVALWMLFTGIALGLVRLVIPETPQPNARIGWELGFMAISSSIAYGFWERALRKGNVIMVVSLSYLTPLLSTLFSSLYLGVRLGWRLWLSCAFVARHFCHS